MLLNLIKIPLIVFEVVLVFNLMIIVHELGHFLAARWRGLVVEKFGIWFGKPLWKKTIDGVEYSLGSIPAGGFVALPQMAPMEVLEGQTETPREMLPPISALDKIIVAFAGPLFSFSLAVAFAALVWMVGRPVTEAEATTTVGYVLPDSPAAQAGFKAGDKILTVDGLPVRRFSGMGEDSITWRIVRSEGETVPFSIQRVVNGALQTEMLYPKPEVPETKPWMRKALREIGILPAQQPMVAKVEPDSPASAAGLLPNDIITGINGQPVYGMESLSDYIGAHPRQPLTLEIDREGQVRRLPFQPRALVEEVFDDSPAQAAGLKAGDTITGVNGQPLADIAGITDFIKAHAGQSIALTVQDPKGVTRQASVTPVVPKGSTVPLVGLIWDSDYGIVEDSFGKFQVLHPSPGEQVYAGMMSIFDTIGAVASRHSGVKLQHMGGPVMMMRVYYMLFQSREGWRMALWFSVVLNVNLALINLLPIPVLDGGHITLALIEAIRRRPVSVRFLEVVQTGCAVVIIGFMLYIAFFDVQDLFGNKPDKLRFEPKDSATQTPR